MEFTSIADAEPSNVPGPNKRVFAFLVDGVIYSVAFTLLTMVLPQLGGLWGWLIWSAYFLVRDLPGASLGKRLSSLAIVDTAGQPATTGSLILRNLPIAIPFVVVAEYFVMKGSPDGRRWGDRWANTRVQDQKPGVSDGRFLWYSIGLVVVLLLLQAVANRLPRQLAVGPARDRESAQTDLNGKPLSDLIEALGSSQSSEALASIVRMGAPAAPALATAALSHANPKVREGAATALGRTGGPNSVATLIKALKDPERDVRVEAADGLMFRAFGDDPDVAGAVPALADALKDPDTLVRGDAASALRVIGPPAKNAVPALVAALQAIQPLVELDQALTTVDLARALATIDEATAQEHALPILISAYDSRPDVRSLIVEGLQDFEAPGKVMPTLLRALGDNDASVRRAAVDGLGKIGPPAASAMPQLTKALKDPDELTGKLAARAIDRISGK